MQTFQGRDSAQGRDKVPEAGRFPAHVPSPQFDFLRHSTSSAPLLPDPEPPWQRPKPTEDSVHTLAWTPRPSRFSLGQGAGRVRLWMLVSCALDAGPWVSSWAAPISLHPIVYSITPFTGTAEGPQGGCHVQGTVPEWDDAEDSPWPRIVLPWGLRPSAQGNRSTAPGPDGYALTAELSLGAHTFSGARISRREHPLACASPGARILRCRLLPYLDSLVSRSPDVVRPLLQWASN